MFLKLLNDFSFSISEIHSWLFRSSGHESNFIARPPRLFILNTICCFKTVTLRFLHSQWWLKDCAWLNFYSKYRTNGSMSKRIFYLQWKRQVLMRQFQHQQFQRQQSNSFNFSNNILNILKFTVFIIPTVSLSFCLVAVPIKPRLTGLCVILYLTFT